VRSAEAPVVVSLVDNRLEECRRGAPDLHDLSREFSGSIIVLILHAEVCPEAYMRISHRTIPQFLIFQRGRIVKAHSGVAQKAAMETWVKAMVPARTEQHHDGFLGHVLQFFSGRFSTYGNRERRSIVGAA